MAKIDLPAGQWTTLPATVTDVVVRGLNGGVYVCTDETPTDLDSAYPVEAGGSIVLTAGLPVHIWPANLRGGRAMWMRI